MLKASALYIVIIIALVIAILCSSLIVTAYFYKTQYQKKFRYDNLENNLNSGVNLLLGGADTSYLNEKTWSLYDSNADSIKLHRIFWGIYDMGVANALVQKDTLFKVFSIANTIDSSKWSAIYLVDADIPLSLSGKTLIRGDSFIPKAGVKETYADNNAYKGDKRLIIGARRISERKLPTLNKGRLDRLANFINEKPICDTNLQKGDSIQKSFLHPTYFVNFKKKVQTIQNRLLNGNIVLFSDTTITIDSTSVLKNILVFAKVVVLKSGFTGHCQIFATDSISIARNCTLEYPSCIGILRFQTPLKINPQPRISIGENTTLMGTIFTYEKEDKLIRPFISFEKNVKIIGQVYSQGYLELKDGVQINGSVITNRFLHRNTITLFENYLINATVDSKALSPYYLTSEFLPVAGKRKKVLQWLEAN